MKKIILLLMCLCLCGCEEKTYEQGYKEGYRACYIKLVGGAFSVPFTGFEFPHICIKNMGMTSIWVDGDYELKSGSLYTLHIDKDKKKMVITYEMVGER